MASENKIPETGADGLLEKIQRYILDNYEPVKDPQAATLRMTTTEVCNALDKFYETEFSNSPTTVAKWLHEKGFTFFDAGAFRFEWLLKSTIDTQ